LNIPFNVLIFKSLKINKMSKGPISQFIEKHYSFQLCALVDAAKDMKELQMELK
jgi:hypothetical protein